MLVESKHIKDVAKDASNGHERIRAVQILTSMMQECDTTASRMLIKQFEFDPKIPQ